MVLWNPRAQEFVLWYQNFNVTASGEPNGYRYPCCYFGNATHHERKYWDDSCCTGNFSVAVSGATQGPGAGFKTIRQGPHNAAAGLRCGNMNEDFYVFGEDDGSAAYIVIAPPLPCNRSPTCPAAKTTRPDFPLRL